MQKRVFISHSSKDWDFATAICERLEQLGIGCWIAPRDIPYGDEWAEQIVKAIQNSQLLLFLLSEHSNQSKHCKREVEHADKFNIPMLYVMTDRNLTMNAGLSYYLNGIQNVLINRHDDAKIEELVNSIKQHFPYEASQNTQDSASHTIALNWQHTITVGTSVQIAVYQNQRPMIIGQIAPRYQDGIQAIDRENDSEIYDLLCEAKKKAEQFLSKGASKAIVSEAILAIPDSFTRKQKNRIKTVCNHLAIIPRFVKHSFAAIHALEDRDMKIAVLNITEKGCHIMTADISDQICQVTAKNALSNFKGIPFMSNADWMQILSLMERTIAESDMTVQELDAIVLIGDIIHEPQLWGQVIKRFGNPSAATAIAVSEMEITKAAMMQNVSPKFLMLDVLSHSIGVESVGGTYFKVIEKNTPIPTKKTIVFSTAVDGQPCLDIRVLQGEAPLAKENVEIGCCRMHGILQAKAGVPKIEVTFRVEQDETIIVSAWDMTSSKRNANTIYID